MKSFSKGATTPLLFNWRNLALLTGTLLLQACSSKPVIPPFTASGYAADDGAVRIWRKDDKHGGTHLLSAFSPWGRGNGNTSTAEYRWQDDRLTSIELNVYGKSREHVKVRFDEKGGLSFMQREVDNNKQQLSSDQVALYQYRASRVKQVSDALRTGRVVLRQGRWQPDGHVLTCEGKIIEPSLDSAAIDHIRRRQSHSSMAVSVAWIEGPDGGQLLLVANENFCTWQPQAAIF